jgi:flagellar FliJ protein
MAFNFKLDKILQHRKNLENLARKDYYEALDVFTEQKKTLENYYTSIDKARENACEVQAKGGVQSTEVLCQIHDFIKGTEIYIERQKLKVRESGKIVEDKQEFLREASIEYKMIERLKEKKKEEYHLNKKKLEEKRMNDLNTIRFKVGKFDE